MLPIVQNLPQTPSHKIKDLSKQPHFAPCMDIGARLLRRARRVTESCLKFFRSNFASCQAWLRFAEPFKFAFGPLWIDRDKRECTSTCSRTRSSCVSRSSTSADKSCRGSSPIHSAEYLRTVLLQRSRESEKSGITQTRFNPAEIQRQKISENIICQAKLTAVPRSAWLGLILEFTGLSRKRFPTASV